MLQRCELVILAAADAELAQVRRLKLTHPCVGYFAAEGLILVAEEAVEIRVLKRQGKNIRVIARPREVSRNTQIFVNRRIHLLWSLRSQMEEKPLFVRRTATAAAKNLVPNFVPCCAQNCALIAYQC